MGSTRLWLRAGASLLLLVVAAGCSLRESPERDLQSMRAAFDESTSVRVSGDFWVVVDGEGRSVSVAGDLNSVGDSEVMVSSALDYVRYITIGSSRYVYYPTLGEWARGTPAAADLDPAGLAWPARWVQHLESPTEATYLGSSTIDGVECSGYRVDVDESGVVNGVITTLADAGVTLSEDDRTDLRRRYSKADITVDVWIGTSDHLPRREQVDILVDDREMTQITGVVEFTEYGEPTRITSPSGYMALAEAEYALAGTAPESYTVCIYTVDWLEAEVDWYEVLHGAPPSSLDEVLEELPTCVSLGTYSLDPEFGDVVCSVHGRYRK